MDNTCIKTFQSNIAYICNPSNTELNMKTRQGEQAAITPVSKKPGCDVSDLSNYRLISNLPFLAKVLERAVATKLVGWVSLGQYSIGFILT